MTYLFKQSRQYLVLIVAMLALMLRGWGMLSPFQPLQQHNSLFSEWLLQGIMANKAQLFLAYFLVVAEAVLLNLLVKQYELVYRHTWMPSLCFLLCCSLAPGSSYLGPQLVCNALLILGLWRLLGLYKSEFANQHLFETGLLFGTCFLLRFELVVLLPFLLVGLARLRVMHLREWLVMLSGYCMPVYLAVVAGVLGGGLPAGWQKFADNFFKDRFPTHLFNDAKPWAASLVALFIFVMGCLKLRANYGKGMLKTRKFQTLIILLMPFMILAAVLAYEDLYGGLVYLSVPASVFMAYYFMGHDWAWWKELLFWVLAGCIVYPQFLLSAG